MDARIVTCAQCGQRNRISATSKTGIWKCRTCGTVLSATGPAAARRVPYRVLLVVALVLLPIVAYASLWTLEAKRSRAFAAAAAHEFSQGNFDRAAVLALSGLPRPGSLFDLFQPHDAEAELRRTGIHQIRDERLLPKAKGASFSVVKERFLVGMTGGMELTLTDLANGQDRRHNIAAVCAGAQAHEGRGPGCVVRDIDADDDGQRLLLALNDGSVWLVAADQSTKALVAPKCHAASNDNASTSSAAMSACAVSRVHLSPTGRHAIISPAPQAFTAIDLETGAKHTLDFTSDCADETAPAAKSLCLENPVRVLTFRGEDVLLSRHGSRATLWLLSEDGATRDLPVPIDRAVTGSDGTFTGYSISGDTVTQIVPASAQTLTLGLTVKVGNCEAAGTAGQTQARAQGCRISSIAVSPKNSDLAIAVTSGDIIVQRPVAGNETPTRRTLTIDCLPLKADAFALFDMDRPSHCSITALRFAPNGSALAAFGNDRVVRVFRTSDGARLASVALEAPVRYFGFDTDGEALVVALDTGAIRRFDLAVTGSTGPKRPSGLGALRGAICASLGDHATPLTNLSDTDLDEVRGRFPGLRLTASDRSPCASP